MDLSSTYNAFVCRYQTTITTAYTIPHQSSPLDLSAKQSPAETPHLLPSPAPNTYAEDKLELIDTYLDSEVPLDLSIQDTTRSPPTAINQNIQAHSYQDPATEEDHPEEHPGQDIGDLPLVDTAPQPAEQIAPPNSDHTLSHPATQPLFLCPQCGQTFTRRHSSVRHIESIHGKGEKPLKCNLCSFATHWPASLTKHMRRVHGTDKWLRSKDSKGLKCSHCPFTSHHRTKMWTHIAEQHEDDTPLNMRLEKQQLNVALQHSSKV